jgi:DNA-binding transcriptional ArsR family regulator
MDLDRAAAKLEALGSSARLSIYRLLVRAGPEGLPVGAIQRRLEMPASTLSHHLHRLVQVDLVSQERVGTSLICRANYDTMDALLGFLGEECCVERDGPPGADRG